MRRRKTNGRAREAVRRLGKGEEEGEGKERGSVRKGVRRVRRNQRRSTELARKTRG